MKSRIIQCILVCFIMLILTACRADEPVEEIEEAFLPIYTESETGEDAYPAVDEAYPVEEYFIPIDESAYPITEADLTWLMQTWRLTTYTENGVDLAPPNKTVTFNANGSYSMMTDTGQESGTWTTSLFAFESSLILINDAGETLYYQIIELDENELNLRIQLGNLQIDEGYLPVN